MINFILYYDVFFFASPRPVLIGEKKHGQRGGLPVAVCIWRKYSRK